MSSPDQKRLGEAVDRALLLGLLKYTRSGGLQHAPFSLAPCPIPQSIHDAMVAMTPAFNRLALAISSDPEFLAEVLAPTIRVDDFTARLLEMARTAGNTQSLFLALTRSDYFIHHPRPDDPPAIRQVELNTISASYLGLSPLVHRLHRHLSEHQEREALIENDPLPAVADAFAQAVECYGHPDAVVLMVVQPGEANVFDQRLLEFALEDRGLKVIRRSLDEIATESKLREGHLTLGGKIVAVTYFRAAYGPEDFTGPDAFRARERIQASSTISVPDLFTQLAGTKKIQQVLTEWPVLTRFLDDHDARTVWPSFTGQYDLDTPIDTEADAMVAWRWAMERPGEYVLKPQREGGGHNFFDRAMVEKLTSMAPKDRPAYILMERIQPAARPGFLIAESQGTVVDAVSEIGRFGVCLADGRKALLNRDVGYLVRTKGQDTHEGGVSAGFGFLDSLILSD